MSDDNGQNGHAEGPLIERGSGYHLVETHEHGKDSDAIEVRRLEVQRLKLMGFPAIEIARRCGVGIATVSSDMEAIRKSWRNKVRDQWRQLLGKIIAEAELVKEEAWAAWMRSVAGGTKVKHKAKKRGRPPKAEGLNPPRRNSQGEIIESLETTTTSQTPGDPRFLTIVNDTNKQLASLLSMDSPGVLLETEGTDEPAVAARARTIGLLNRLDQLAALVDDREGVDGGAGDAGGDSGSAGGGGHGIEPDGVEGVGP